MKYFKNLFISFCSFSIGGYFLFLSIKMLITLGPTLFQYDPNPLYSYRWSDVFSEFVISIIVGVGFTANGLWFFVLSFYQNLKKETEYVNGDRALFGSTSIEKNMEYFEILLIVI